MAPNELSEKSGEHKKCVADVDCRKTEILQRAQWLRAASLGANDGLLSTTSLMIGVGALREDRWSMVLSGLAGALAGACSMAVGEFVSVSTQRDIEKATLASFSKSNNDVQDAPGNKLDINTSPSDNIQCGKCTPEPIQKVSPKILNMRTEQKFPLGVSPKSSPIIEVITGNGKESAVTLQEKFKEEVCSNPYKAAAASALAFLCGSFLPLISAILVSQSVIRIAVIIVVASIALLFFGGLGAYLGGAPARISAARVLIGGWISMAIAYGLLKPFDGHGKDSNEIG